MKNDVNELFYKINKTKEINKTFKNGKIHKDVLSYFNESIGKSWNKNIDKWDAYSFIDEACLNNNYPSDLRPFILMENKINRSNRYFSNALAEFTDSYKIMSKELKINAKKLHKQILIDDEITKKNTETQRMNDLSYGIFDHAETNNRFLYNSLFNRYVSEKQKELIILQNIKIKNMYLFLYMKLEELLYGFYSLFNPRPKILYWKQKIKTVEKHIEFENDEINEIKKVFDISRFLKHQEPIWNMDFDNYEIVKDIIIKYFNYYFEKYNYSKFTDFVEEIKNTLDSIYNPLGLTGME